MKNKWFWPLLIVSVIGAAIAAVGFYDYTETITGAVSVNKDRDTLYGEYIPLNPTSDPVTIPKYKSAVVIGFVSPADTGSVDVTDHGTRDSAQMAISGWLQGVKLPIHTTTMAVTLPETIKVVISDTGLTRNLFYYDGMQVDFIVVDTAGDGATDSLWWTASYRARLIER